MIIDVLLYEDLETLLNYNPASNLVIDELCKMPTISKVPNFDSPSLKTNSDWTWLIRHDSFFNLDKITVILWFILIESVLIVVMFGFFWDWGTKAESHR